MLLAARLALSEQEVVLWTRSEEQAALIGEQGVTMESASDAGNRRVDLQAVPLAEARQGAAGLVLVAVKQTAWSERLLRRLSQAAAADAAVVLFQNGIGHVERLQAALPGRLLLTAVTTEAALRTGPASVRHTGTGETWIGSEIVQPAAQTRLGIALNNVRKRLEKAGFSVFLSNEIKQRVLRKLLINSVINPLSAIWRVTNGELPNAPERLTAMQALFRESVRILRRHGGLQEEADAALWEAVLEVCAATSANRSSMLQDVLAGRPTEIDAMNGHICRMAAEVGEPSPWNEIVATLVKAIQ